ncbi:MAG TPA: hypothetical protein VFC15_10795 [Candidatus Limnocylindrales bacterium]|nr:hypothetical protein [Candidatus Limnocylindrales bacterium]
MSSQLKPDLNLCARDLRAIVQKENRIKQALAFRLGLARGLTINALSAVAGCSQSHVTRMLLLVELPMGDAIAIANGAA